MAVHPQFMIHPEYARKYGTISPGVLARSVKYAETWLYGTVGVRGSPAQRPSLFLYPGVVAAPRSEPRAPLPRFVPVPHNGSHRNTRSICQCLDTPRGAVCRQCGVRRARTQTRARQTLLGATPQEEPRAVAASTDPYNLMRKSRLGVGETTETSIINPKTKQKRNRSSSPMNRKDTVSSFETFKPKVESSWVTDSQAWESDSDGEERRPKSILECNVSAYDLNVKDESSDDLSDGTLEINSKLKILRPKLKKTEVRNKKINIPEPKKLPDPEVRLSGQRFRIFDPSHPSTDSVEGYVSDKELRITDESPKRPPRKPKQNGLRLSKLRSTSSPNLSIKSILKKPCEDGSDSSLNESTPPDSGDSSKVFDLKTKKQTQSTLKKKKQVQFRVVGSTENVATPEGSPEKDKTLLGEPKTEELHPEGEKKEPEKVTESCLAEPPDVANVSEVAAEVPSGNEAACDDRKELAEDTCESNADSIQDSIQGT